MSPQATEYCESCKSNTRRCEYYPVGRSRQHGRCLECDRKDTLHPAGYRNRNPGYCYTCDQMPSDRFRP
jgi:hypothetical protein